MAVIFCWRHQKTLRKRRKLLKISQISITFDLDGIFTICFQFLKDKRELFNIFAGFWKILSKMCQKFGPNFDVFDLSTFFLVDLLKRNWDLVTWQNLVEKCSLHAMMLCAKNQAETILSSTVRANSIFWNLIGLCTKT